MYTTEKFNPANFVPQRFESDHTIELNGQSIPYHTVAEDNVFYDKSGKPIASIFSYSYFRTDVDPTNRPVIFGFNGGPGSSSYFVHAGFLSTKRVSYSDEITRPTALPPYKVIDNPDCLLDVADIVVIDPVNTGYGILLDEEKGDQFFGITPDAEALNHFVEMWMHRYNRFLSPKYLVGESYGCTRNANAAGIAADGGRNRTYDLGYSGIVMIGNTVTTGKYFGKELPVEHCVIAFQTYAGVNWYHNHPTNQSVEEFVEEAKAFAEKEYIVALFRGESLVGEEREEMLNKVSYYTGCSKEYLDKRNLVIDETTFRQEVIKAKGKSVSRYDGRIVRDRYYPEIVEEEKAMYDDAAADCYGAEFLAAVCGEIMPMLNVKMDRTYVAMFRTYDRQTKTTIWSKEEPMGTTGEQLNKAMRMTPGMRVFFANGRFDCCTYTGYIDHLLNHGGLPKERICRKNYNSGHMIYFGEENVKELCADIREFILGGMPKNK